MKLGPVLYESLTEETEISFKNTIGNPVFEEELCVGACNFPERGGGRYLCLHMTMNAKTITGEEDITYDTTRIYLSRRQWNALKGAADALLEEEEGGQEIRSKPPQKSHEEGHPQNGG